MSIVVTIQRVRPGAVLPSRSSDGAAGWDLTACIGEPLTVSPGQRVMIPTGIAVALPSPMWVALLFGRSGLGVKHGLTLSNAVGVIDSDYRGEILAGLINHGQEAYTVNPGDRIAQLVVMPVAQAILTEAEDLPLTQRGAEGFGSTGR